MDSNALITALKGMAGDSSILRELLRISEPKLASFKPVTMPGDAVTSKHVMSAPPAPDLWYLFNHVNMLTWGDSTPADSFMAERLPFFDTKMGGIKPLKGIVQTGEVTGKQFGLFDEKMDWTNDAHDWVQLIAFELRFNGQSFQYSTEIPMPQDAVGYIMIPIGGMGVMEVISLVQETVVEDSAFAMPNDAVPKVVNAGIDKSTNLWPPKDGWIPDACYGRKLIETTTKIPESESAKVFIESRYSSKVDENGVVVNTKIEIPMERIYGKGVTQNGAYDASRPGLPLVSYIQPKVTESGVVYGGGWVGKQWLRVWITREDKWPVPGEFIGILVKPCPVPPHVWWFQRSSPLLYAGNWMDTLDLTSGVITAVTADVDHPLTQVACTEYSVKIHGVDSVKVYSSDFLAYEVGARVAIWKNRTDELPLALKEGAPGTNYASRPDIAYDQMEQQEWGEPVKNETYSEYYVILPLTFFQ